MTLSDLGSIGEFVSSIAVIVSLLYLAYQVKQNTSQMRRNEFNAILEETNQVRKALLDESLASVVVTARTEPERLSAEQQLRLGSLLEMAMWQNYNIWDRVRHRVIEEDHWHRSKGTIRVGMGDDFSKAWWRENRDAFEAEFAREIDDVIDSQD